MIPLLKLVVVFALVIFLLRRKYNIGLVMLVAALVLGLVFGLEPGAIAAQMAATLVAPATIVLMGVLVLIMIMESVMRKTGMLEVMTGALFHLPLNRRLVFVSIPAIIGLLPSAGGARFSAPLVARATEGTPYRAEDRVFINYWFRHVWEFSLPLYPGLILAAHISGVPLETIILWQWPFTLTWAVLGYYYIFKLRGATGKAGRDEITAGCGKKPGELPAVVASEEAERVKAGEDVRCDSTGEQPGNGGGDKDYVESRDGKKRWLGTLAASTWPLWVVVALVLFRVPMLVALCIVLGLLVIQKRYPLKQVALILKEPMTLKICILIWGIMAFKDVLQASGAVGQVSRFVVQLGVPAVLLAVFLSLLAGVLTGLVTACIGVSFPLVMAMIEPTVVLVMLTYVAGVVGVMLSPVHLCLVLTVEYFRADFFRSYCPLIVPSMIVLAGAAGLYWFAR